jgi:Glycosyltransferase
MNILQISVRFLPAEGGTERATYYLSKELYKANHNVTVLTSNLNSVSTDVTLKDRGMFKQKTAGFPSTELFDGVRVQRFPYYCLLRKNSYTISPDMLNYNTKNYDVVHFQGLNRVSSFFLISSLARLRGQKYIATTHGVAELLWRPLYSSFYVIHLYMKQAARVITVCNYEFEQLKRLGIPKEKLAVIPNGVDLAKFREKPSANEAEALKYKYNLDKFVFLFTGRVVPNKGLENMIKAAVHFKDKPVSFVIVGPTQDTIYLDALKQRAASYGLSSKFRFIGWLPDVEVVKFLHLSNVFVFPSLLDTFGLVNAEAMAAGKPVIATSVGGVPEVVKHGETGLIIPPGDPVALSNALFFLMDNPDTCMQMGERGRLRAEELYSWKRICRETLAIYEDLK